MASPGGVLFDRLERDFRSFTAAERVIAKFILQSGNAIAFETATSVAERLGVSAVTVGRFCRKLGYRHFRDLKGELKADIGDVPWPAGEALAAFVSRSDHEGRLKRTLEHDIAAIVEVYSMIDTAEWRSIVSLLSHASILHVAGFQSERAFGHYLVNILQYVRRDVHLVDMTSGNFADVLADDRENRCLVVFETRRYSKQAYTLCEKAYAAGIDLVVITDKYCNWARKFTPHVIAVSTASELFWSSSSALSVTVTQLCNGVVAKLGSQVEPRLEQFTELYQDFVGHISDRRRA